MNTIRLEVGRVGSKCSEHGKTIKRAPDPYTGALFPDEPTPDAIGCDVALQNRSDDV